MPDEKDGPYEVEPTPQDPPAEGSAGSSRAKIEAPGLLEGFDEDADFDEQPEPKEKKSEPEQPRLVGPPLVREHRGSARAWLIAGCVLLVVALVASAINAASSPVARVFLTLYNVLLHAGTGVAALYVLGLLERRPVGKPEDAAARMFAAVAALALVFRLNIAIVGSTHIEETLLGAAAYAAAVFIAFAVWGRSLLILVGTHLLLWLVVQVGTELAKWVHAPASGGAA